MQRYRILVRYGMRYGIGNKCAVRYSILGSAVYRKCGIVPQLRYCDMRYPCGIAVLRYWGMRYPCSICCIELYYEIHLPDLQLVLFGQH